MSTQPLKLRLLNDHEVIVRGLQTMLAPFSERVRIVEKDVGATTADRRVDVTLFDTFACEPQGANSLEDVVKDPRSGSVVVFAWSRDQALVQSALGRGARGYITKSVGARRLVDYLEAVHDGLVITALDDASPAGRKLPEAAEWPGQSQGLTLREAEVVAWITQGLSNVEIADRCYISMNSLKSCIRSAYRKMGVERRAQAVRWGFEHGMAPR
ncbi:MAG: LuxR C-terminal-related transcriptional regulator [Galactobacter sp.]